ncbi:MAG: PDDEXK nuclease domain-containing protein [Chloroflexota bacterium]
MGESSLVPAGYQEFLGAVKQRIQQAQVRAALAVNRELVLLYWGIGRDILDRQVREGWGGKVIERLAGDLRRAFPSMRGLSRSNLHYMRAFAEAYPDEAIVHQLGGQIPWRHNVYLLDSVKDAIEREWYIRKTIENGWSRSVLMHQVEGDLFHRQGKAPSNFTITLPAPDSGIVQDMLKDPYNFDFLTLSDHMAERDVHQGLISHMRDFLTELGRGFAFVGSEYQMELNGREYRLDLLFYHLHLRRFVVIELKPGEFEPEYAGKINFYLSLVDDQLRHPTDSPRIGIVLCKSRDRLVVEYALHDMTKPIGVSEYLHTLMPTMISSLPEPLRSSLPSVEELEAELGRAEEDIRTGASDDS